MTKSTLFALALITAIGAAPLSAYAHASPVESEPRSSAGVVDAPQEIRIRFSERLEQDASRIVVKNEAGERIHTNDAVVDPANPHVLTLALPAAGEGTYQVSWSVVSSDDGHFTRGGYTYFVGAEIAAVATAPQVEVVQLSALPEATTIFVELLGNSLLLGVLFLFAFGLRRLLPTLNERERRIMLSIHTGAVVLGVFAIVAAGSAHVVLKATELAGLHSIALMEAMRVYVGTVSGTATIGRSVVALIFLLVFLFGRRIMVRARSITYVEIVLFLLLCVFAYLRAKVSHATANPFFPEWSVAVNFMHLLGKDAWAGLLLLLSVMYVTKSGARRLPDILPAVFRIMIVASGVVAVTALYIIWLHLKDVANISSTLWGERFLPLALSAALAIALLGYHVVIARWRPAFFERYLRFTLPAEATVGVLIVFFSSLMIITSPPLEAGQGTRYTTVDQGVTIELSAAPNDEGQVRIGASTRKGADIISEPTVFLGEGGDEALRLDLEERFPGGYVFPVHLLSDTKTNLITIIVQQEGGYDAHARFSVEKHELTGTPDGGRELDAFTLTMIVLGMLSLVFVGFLYGYAPKAYGAPQPGSISGLIIGVVATVLIASQLIGLAHYFLGNRFKAECVADGNAWHLMLPTRNSVPVSSVPQEGCMALGGSFHITDVREYQYLKQPDRSVVTFATDLAALSAGKPHVLSFSITDEQGEPAPLSVAHERLVHILIVSADRKEFWHVHPEREADGSFTLPFTFPRSGQYMFALDYTQGITPVTKIVDLAVSGGIPQDEVVAQYADPAVFDGYSVSLKYPLLLAQSTTTLTYRITKDGVELTDLEPYLAAAMHVAVVKNDEAKLIHTHGEVHSLNPNLTPAQASQAHNHLPPPPRFGPVVETHVAFPSPGFYTLFGEFKHDGKVITTAFTVRVE